MTDVQAEYHVTVTVDYLDGTGGVLPFYNIPAAGRLDAIEKVLKAIRELYEARQFDVNDVQIRPSPHSPTRGDGE